MTNTAAMPTFNMAAYCLEHGARNHPDKPALIVMVDPGASAPAEIWTYAALDDAVLRTAAALHARGFERGDRLAIALENTSSYAILFFGAIAAGLVAIPVSSQLTAAELRFVIEDSGAALFRADEVAATMRGAVRATYAATDAEDPAFLIYTSGTSAEPKGVLHAQRSILGRRPMYEGWYAMTPDDRVLHAGAFNWTFTLGTGLSDPWVNGATAIIYTGEKDPALWPRLIRNAEATLFACVPGLARQILKYAPPCDLPLPSLRHGLIAGETPPPGLFDEWRARTGTELYEALGMSELSTYISSSPTVPRRVGMIGKAQPGRSVAILPAEECGEDGEKPLPAGAEGLIAVDRSDPGLMLGYWRRANEEALVYRGKWFIGGDLGLTDSDGYIAYRGRTNDLMKALGYRVSPLEVETVLARHPEVAEVACAEVGVRADVSVIGAFIVPRNTGQTPDPAALRSFAAERLAAYKCPREIRFVNALPRTANGKIRRRELASLYEQSKTPR